MSNGNEDVVNLVKQRRLTGKQKAFITEYLKNGRNGAQAALKVYNANYNVARSISSENLTKPNIQFAIEQALISQDATPEFAVGTIKKVAEQVEINPSAALNASVKILELHGWNKADRPDMKIQVKNAFFNGTRKQTKPKVNDDTIIDM
jgi:phage terminase small subunit